MVVEHQLDALCPERGGHGVESFAERLPLCFAQTAGRIDVPSFRLPAFVPAVGCDQVLTAQRPEKAARFHAPLHLGVTSFGSAQFQSHKTT